MNSRTLLGISLLVSMAGRAYAQSSGTVPGTKHVLDTENGFRTYHFGDTITRFPQLRQFFADGTTVSFTDPHEQLQFAGVPLFSILYTFDKGRLTSIAFDAKGRRNSHRLEQALVVGYGPGEPSPAPLKGYHWSGRLVVLQFSPATYHNRAAQALLLRLPE